MKCKLEFPKLSTINRFPEVSRKIKSGIDIGQI